jgi:excisionase family DNA binding protein
MIEKGKELQRLLQSSPEIVAFAKTLQQAKEPVLLLENDRLVQAGEAANILGVNKSYIGQLVKQGLLTPYYTPGSSYRKFRLSEVWSIPKKEVV